MCDTVSVEHKTCLEQEAPTFISFEQDHKAKPERRENRDRKDRLDSLDPTDDLAPLETEVNLDLKDPLANRFVRLCLDRGGFAES